MSGDRLIGCAFCHRAEKGNPKHHKEVTSFVCSGCVQKLLQAPQAKLVEAHRLALEKGYHEKASWLESFIDDVVEVFTDVRETEKIRPCIVREKIMRMAGPSHNQIGA